jgi:plastocyanin
MPTATMEITIENYRFNPPSLEIPTGTTVAWTNLDIIPHTVTSEDGQLDSGTLVRDATFTHTFTTSGEIPYYCFLHRTMLGTISVT